MSINIYEEDLVILLRSLMKEKMTDKILYYSPMVDFNKNPNIILELGDYFHSIGDDDMAEYYYKEGINFQSIRSDALAKVASFYIEHKMADKLDELEKKYQFDEKVCTKLAINISQMDTDRAIELLKRFPSRETYDALRNICSHRNHSGCYIQTNLILAKKYGDKVAMKQLRNEIKFAVNNYIMYKDHYDKTPEILKSGYEMGKLFGYMLTMGRSSEKCYSCNEKELQIRSIGWDDCFVHLECKHYLCQRCCYDKMDENTCLIGCPCGYKSTRVFNLLLNNFDNLSQNIHIN